MIYGKNGTQGFTNPTSKGPAGLRARWEWLQALDGRGQWPRSEHVLFEGDRRGIEYRPVHLVNGFHRDRHVGCFGVVAQHGLYALDDENLN